MSRIGFNIVIAFAALAGSATLLGRIENSASAATVAVKVPAPAFDATATADRATAIFAGGCFWGVQGVFQHVKGVTSAVSGYSGGVGSTAHYREVGSGRTDHAEAVRVTYDPRQVSYGTLLQIYFAVVADPTTLDFQGPDHGPQYRSALFPTTPEQRLVAERYIAQLGTSGAWPRPIVTRIEAYRGFFPAEAYHQDYLTLNPDAPYIRVNDMPKVAALRQGFPALYRATPVLVGRAS
jgi:peptide-methionine (S)-S-oxide reductase